MAELARTTVGNTLLLEVDADPDGALTAPLGSLAFDSTNGVFHFNTDGATAWFDLGDQDVTSGSAPAFLVSGLSVAAKTITVTDDDSAASNGTALLAQIYQGEATLWSVNDPAASSDFDNTDNTEGFYVGYNADPATNYGAVQVYFDEDGTAGSRFLFVSPFARDIYVQGFNGRMLKLTHDASAATNGVAVYFDANGASKEARLLFVSPTNVAGSDNLPTLAGRIGIS